MGTSREFDFVRCPRTIVMGSHRDHVVPQCYWLSPRSFEHGNASRALPEHWLDIKLKVTFHRTSSCNDQLCIHGDGASGAYNLVDKNAAHGLPVCEVTFRLKFRFTASFRARSCVVRCYNCVPFIPIALCKYRQGRWGWQKYPDISTGYLG